MMLDRLVKKEKIKDSDARATAAGLNRMKFSVHVCQCFAKDDGFDNVIVNEDIYIIVCNNKEDIYDLISPYLSVNNDKMGNIDGKKASNIKNFIRKIVSIDDWNFDIKDITPNVPVEVSFCNYEIERVNLDLLEIGECVDVIYFE